MIGKGSTLALILLSVALNASAQIFLRLGARQSLGQGGLVALARAILLQPATLAGFACYGLSLVVWLSVLSRVEASYAYPFLGLGFVLVAAAGWALLGEELSAQRLLATGLIVIGVIVMAKS